MKILWAPWRMEYIKMKKDSICFLCEIERSDEDSANLVLRRGEHCIMLLNRYPYNSGHLMIVPRRHVGTLDAMNDDERLEMMRMASDACELLGKALGAQGFNAGLNLGSCAGGGLKDHIHLHIVPRWAGDTNFMPVVANAKVLPQALDEQWTILTDVMREP